MTLHHHLDPDHADLEAAVRASWSEATGGGLEVDGSPRPWSVDNPAGGHCDVTSLVVRERLGGDLRMCQVFRGGELSEHHYWNVLPDGREIDLTHSQFSGDEDFGPATHMDQAFFDAAGPMKGELVDRLERFRSAVLAAEGSSNQH